MASKARGGSVRGGASPSSSISKQLTIDSFAPSASQIAQKSLSKSSPSNTQIQSPNKYALLNSEPSYKQVVEKEREPLTFKTKSCCTRHALLEQEMGDLNAHEPWDLLKQLIPKDFGWIPVYGTDKPLSFYQYILIDTNSIEITQNVNENAPDIIAYSQYKILKVLTLSDWGQSPIKPKRFSRVFDPPVFNYWDYQKA